MKTIQLLLAAVSLQTGYAQVHDQDFKKLGWLQGTWTRTNAKPGSSGSERWTKISDHEWVGIGLSLHGSDTAFVEKLKLMAKDGDIFYVADVPENRELVYFRFTEVGPSHFICENQLHDFPKKIVYRREGNVLKASISGNGKVIEYLFEKD